VAQVQYVTFPAYLWQGVPLVLTKTVLGGLMHQFKMVSSFAPRADMRHRHSLIMRSIWSLCFLSAPALGAIETRALASDFLPDIRGTLETRLALASAASPVGRAIFVV
jgi:hypothetical protein